MSAKASPQSRQMIIRTSVKYVAIVDLMKLEFAAVFHSVSSVQRPRSDRELLILCVRSRTSLLWRASAAAGNSAKLKRGAVQTSSSRRHGVRMAKLFEAGSCRSSAVFMSLDGSRHILARSFVVDHRATLDRQDAVLAEWSDNETISHRIASLESEIRLPFSFHAIPSFAGFSLILFN